MNVRKTVSVIIAALSMAACDSASFKKTAFEISGASEKLSRSFDHMEQIMKQGSYLTPEAEQSIANMKNDLQTLPAGQFSYNDESTGECNTSISLTYTINKNNISAEATANLNCPLFDVNHYFDGGAISTYKMKDGIISTTYVSGDKGMIPPKMVLLSSSDTSITLASPTTPELNSLDDLRSTAEKSQTPLSVIKPTTYIKRQ